LLLVRLPSWLVLADRELQQPFLMVVRVLTRRLDCSSPLAVVVVVVEARSPETTAGQEAERATTCQPPRGEASVFKGQTAVLVCFFKVQVAEAVSAPTAQMRLRVLAVTVALGLQLQSLERHSRLQVVVVVVWLPPPAPAVQVPQVVVMAVLLDREEMLLRTVGAVVAVLVRLGRRAMERAAMEGPAL
jgi:hypothetical protein